ncbi:MAG: NADPH-dependent FMN reductase [Neisseria sp.]|nr:NADPH-dependent FMN reductase [Neisseria sp.]
MKNILILLGSLRRDSFNRKVAEYIVANPADGLSFAIADISDLPVYNQDFDDDSPAPYTRLRNQVQQADGVLFVSPEHNRGMPAALKNAIDVCSRPGGKSVWSGKPVAVITASPASTGGMAANLQIRQSMVVLGAPCLPMEAYLNTIHKSLDENGDINNASVKRILADFGNALAEWVNRF